jgi:hypothetical protein
MNGHPHVIEHDTPQIQSTPASEVPEHEASNPST